MNNIIDLVNRINEKGVKIELVNNGIKITGPKGVLNKDIILEIKSHKQQFIKLLSYNTIPKLSIVTAEKKDYYVLSSAQKRLYFLQKLVPNTVAYNLSQILEINKQIDVVKLADSFQKLITRHESLRTSIELIDGIPFQIIHDNVEFHIDYYETSSQSQIHNIINNFIKPFHLEVPCYLRVTLIKKNAYEYVLLRDIHHIISDAVSLDILNKELSVLQAERQLPPLRFQYKDYAEWQNKLKIENIQKKQEEYWIRQFNGEIPLLSLPIDNQRTLLRKFEGSSISFILEEEVTIELRKLINKEGITLFIVLLAIYNVFLSILSGQEDIIVGIPSEGRNHIGLQDIVGMFVNTLALRSYPKGEKIFIEFLRETATLSIQSFDNQDYQFEDLIEKLKITRDLNRNPLFDAVLAVQNNVLNSEKAKKDFGKKGLNEDKFEVLNKVSNFDLTLYCTEGQNNLLFSFEYSSSIFRKETIERFINYFKTLIVNVVESPNKRINQLKLLSFNEERKLLNKLCGKKIAFNKKISFIKLFEKQIKKTPNKIAIKLESKTFTYKELNNSANRVANFLLESKNSNNQPIVAVYLERDIHILTYLLGILKAGYIYLPIETEYPEERVKFILENCKPDFLIVDSFNLGRKEIINYPTKMISIEDTAFLRNYPEKNPDIDINPDDLAYIIYTSGTTGKPKGTKIHHLGMLNHLYAKINDLKINGKDNIAQTASIGFDISMWQLLAGLVVGASIVIIDKKSILNPYKFIKLIQSENISILEIVPSILKVLVENEQLKGSSLRWMISTGEAINVAVVKEWYTKNPQIKLLNAYGPTEASDDITHYFIPQDISGNIVPIGYPIQNTHIYILDGNLKICPIGVKGEICVSGFGVGKGYLNAEEKTNISFVPNPFIELIADSDYGTIYKTGDIGYCKEDGTIICLGRLDDQIKIAGNRIELGEIQNCILTYKLVKEAVVIVKTNENGEKILCAYYISDDEIASNDIKEYLSRHLPSYMIPPHVAQLKNIPLTQNGKIDINALSISKIENDNALMLPRNEIEEKLLNIWAKLLNIENGKIGTNCNFFELGGNSLRIIQLISQIHKEFDVKIDLKYIFENPTIENLYKKIDMIKWASKMEYDKNNSEEKEILI